MAEEIKRGPYTLIRRLARSFPVEEHPHRFSIVLCLAWTLWLLYFASELVLACRITRTSIQPTREVWIAVGAEFVSGARSSLGLAHWTSLLSRAKPPTELRVGRPVGSDHRCPGHVLR